MAGGGQWLLQGTHANVACGALLAELDLSRPHLGLHSLKTPGEPALAGKLLSIWPRAADLSAHDASSSRIAPEEPYVRGSDLVVMYREPCGEPYWLQLYLRLLPSEGRQAAALEVILSIQTRLWEAYPSIAVASALRTSETIARNDYVIYRAGHDWSYIEATLPGDFQAPHHVLVSNELSSAPWRFDECFMERGVIRRLRLRAAIVPRRDDEAQALQLVEALQGEQPPLTA
ncbi:MAG: hypothetical protein IT424_10975 [Pirellulales bacterium]|nr:hypothetical protein [Pirellulales bacterium]